MLPKGRENWVIMQNQQLVSLLKWKGHGKFSICLHLFINFFVQPWLGGAFVVSVGSGSLLGILTKERKEEAGYRILATSCPHSKRAAHYTTNGEEKASCVSDLRLQRLR